MNQQVEPTPFPGEVAVYEVFSTTTRIPEAEAEHRRKLQRQTSYLLLFLMLVLSLATGYLLFTIASKGTPEGQKLAFGLIGAVLGAFWSHYAKLVDSVSKR